MCTDLLSNYYSEASEKITRLTEIKDQLSREVKRLFSENEFLLGKHLAKSETLQAEVIDLPQKLEDMQFYCLKLKEDLITALVAKERCEETYRGEILFLKGMPLLFKCLIFLTCFLHTSSVYFFRTKYVGAANTRITCYEFNSG